jgi:hypothetical protein
MGDMCGKSWIMPFSQPGGRQGWIWGEHKVGDSIKDLESALGRAVFDASGTSELLARAWS